MKCRNHFATTRRPQRATTMLYITGILAVMGILSFGLVTQTVRNTHQLAIAYDRSRAVWLARGSETVIKGSVEIASIPELQTGFLSIAEKRRDGDTTKPTVIVLVPRVNPRLAVELSDPRKP